MSQSWLCYLLENSFGKTYIGATNNFKRRIRQHNGEIKGGAKYTSANKPWEPVLIVLGMPDKITALMLEWRMKKHKSSRTGKLVPCKSCRPRIINTIEILNSNSITSRSISPREIEKITIVIHTKYKDYLDLDLVLSLNDNIEIKMVDDIILFCNII